MARKAEYDRAVSQMTRSEIEQENKKRRVLITKYKAKKLSVIKDPNAPKRPVPSYVRFFVENRDPSKKIQESAAEQGQRWKTMSQAEKQVCP